MEPSPTSYKPGNRKFTLSFDARMVIVILLVVIAAMLAVWQPWRGLRSSTGRTIQVTGQSTVKAEPDEYQFSPSYEFNTTSKDAANKAANDKSTDVVAGLKKQGVEDKNIKTNITSYSGEYRPDGTVNKDSHTYTLMVTITVNNKELAQTVQDFLNTTSPQGVITPYATFSEAKRKQLENAARDDATKDARSKAEQSAKNLGFKIGDVKDVQDGQGFGGIAYADSGTATAVAPMPASISMDSASDAAAKTVMGSIMPGENNLSYTVTVTYYLR